MLIKFVNLCAPDVHSSLVDIKMFDIVTRGRKIDFRPRGRGWSLLTPQGKLTKIASISFLKNGIFSFVNVAFVRMMKSYVLQLKFR